MRASTERISPSGRRTPGASRSSATSTNGTGAARRCASASTAASGRSSFPASAPARITNMKSSARHGELLPLKADPLGFEAELRPSTASVVARTRPIHGATQIHMRARAEVDPRRSPMSIYEVHLPLLAARRGRALPRPMTNSPISSSPMSPIWASPISSCCRSTSIRSTPPGAISRSGSSRRRAGSATPQGFRPLRRPRPSGRARRHSRLGAGAFPDRRAWPRAVRRRAALRACRSARAASIPTGTPRSTISAAARWRISSSPTRSIWLDRFHIDGLRVDAVASMLYLDYSRKAGRMGAQSRRLATTIATPSPFFKGSTKLVYALYPGVVTIAEESTAWAGVSRPTYAGGLGFGFKWNMGWMNDTLRYMSSDPVHRKWRHNELTFGLLYAFTENFVLPLSHDEVVHGKGSIIGKMPGDEWRRFATARAYYGFMWGHPGQEAPVHGPGVRSDGRMEFREQRSTGGLLGFPAASGLAGASSAISTASIAITRRCTRATARPKASSGSSRTTRRIRYSPSLRFGADRSPRDRRRIEFHAGDAQRLSARPAARGTLARDSSIPTRRSMAARDSAISARFMRAPRRSAAFRRAPTFFCRRFRRSVLRIRGR